MTSEEENFSEDDEASKSNSENNENSEIVINDLGEFLKKKT